MPITLDGTLGVGTPGITLAGGAITANANQLNSSSEDINSENRIINGDFGVWQRAVSGTFSGYTAADRWINAASGGTVTQSRQAFTLGDTLGIIQPTFFLRQTVSGQTLTTSVAQTVQRIEGVRSYAGQTITVLGWARRSSGTGNMAVETAQYFGSGGAGISNSVFLAPTTVTLGSSWAPFAVVINVPSVLGKTLGTNGNDWLEINFWASSGSDYNARTNSLGLQTIGVDLWGIHIRVGTWTAADTALYRPRDPGTELALCRRYYNNNNGAGILVYLLAYNVINNATSSATSTGVPMRKVPDMSILSNSSSNLGTFTIGATNSGYVFAQAPTLATGQVQINIYLIADAEL